MSNLNNNNNDHNDTNNGDHNDIYNTDEDIVENNLNNSSNSSNNSSYSSYSSYSNNGDNDLNNSINTNNTSEQTWEDLVRQVYGDEELIELYGLDNEINNQGNEMNHQGNEMNHKIYEDYFSDLEEDSDDDNSDYIKSDKYNTNYEDKQCPNNSVITLTPYDVDDDQLCIIKIQNSDGIFTNGHCFTKNEIKQWIKSDLGQLPTNIMSIFTKPRRKENLLNGCSGRATGRLIVKMPDQMYVTLGSLDKILHNKNRIWYALPLFGGQKRRVGNLASICGAGMNHGQIPGFKIYKLFKRDEIQRGVTVKETNDDYPLSLFMFDHMTPLMNILGLENSDNIELVSTLRDIVFQKFTDGIINNLLRD